MRTAASTRHRCLCGHVESSHRIRQHDLLERRAECMQCDCDRYHWDHEHAPPPRPTSPPPPVSSGAGRTATVWDGQPCTLMSAVLSMALHTANKRLRELGDRTGYIPVPGCVCPTCAPVPAPPNEEGRPR